MVIFGNIADYTYRSLNPSRLVRTQVPLSFLRRPCVDVFATVRAMQYYISLVAALLIIHHTSK